ncbi:MAG TPA: Kazal-type serine protease inhibitor domain-containing protein [Thermoanaerobaculia bacterium]
MKNTRKVSRKLLPLLALMGLSAFALSSRPARAFCECAPLGGEYCGANGVTYDSPCVAACFHVKIVHSGPC